MEERYIIGLDLGTTALKIAIFDAQGELQGVSTQEYPLITPAVHYVEEDVEVYWSAFKEGLSEVMAATGVDPAAVCALGISAQGETLVCLDKEGKPVRNAIVWLDNRAQKQADELREALGGDEVCYRITGR